MLDSIIQFLQGTIEWYLLFGLGYATVLHVVVLLIRTQRHQYFRDLANRSTTTLLPLPFVVIVTFVSVVLSWPVLMYQYHFQGKR